MIWTNGTIQWDSIQLGQRDPMGFYSMGSNGIFSMWPMGFVNRTQWDLSMGPNGICPKFHVGPIQWDPTGSHWVPFNGTQWEFSPGLYLLVCRYQRFLVCSTLWGVTSDIHCIAHNNMNNELVLGTVWMSVLCSCHGQFWGSGWSCGSSVDGQTL